MKATARVFILLGMIIGFISGIFLMFNINTMLLGIAIFMISTSIGFVTVLCINDNHKNIFLGVLCLLFCSVVGGILYLLCDFSSDDEHALKTGHKKSYGEKVVEERLRQMCKQNIISSLQLNKRITNIKSDDYSQEKTIANEIDDLFFQLTVEMISPQEYSILKNELLKQII